MQICLDCCSALSMTVPFTRPLAKLACRNVSLAARLLQRKTSLDFLTMTCFGCADDVSPCNRVLGFSSSEKSHKGDSHRRQPASNVNVPILTEAHGLDIPQVGLVSSDIHPVHGMFSRASSKYALMACQLNPTWNALIFILHVVIRASWAGGMTCMSRPGALAK